MPQTHGHGLRSDTDAWPAGAVPSNPTNMSKSTSAGRPAPGRPAPHRLQDGVDVLGQRRLEVGGVQRPALVVGTQLSIGEVGPAATIAMATWCKLHGRCRQPGECADAVCTARRPVGGCAALASYPAAPSLLPMPTCPRLTCCRRCPLSAPPQTSRTRAAQCAARTPGTGCPQPA